MRQTSTAVAAMASTPATRMATGVSPSSIWKIAKTV